MMRILGSLESTPTPSLREWHERLVENLEVVVNELDDVQQRD